MAHIAGLSIIGGGPAGLRAAEVAAESGIKVTLFDAKPSVGRKFLIAGKGGLNLTHSEPLERFVKRYSTQGTTELFWTSLLAGFDNTAMRFWAENLGIETFIGTSGRVFPKEFKAAPLLRRWVERLRVQGVHFITNHKLVGIVKNDDRFTLKFQQHHDKTPIVTDALILALGGGSWPETGSTGEWVSLLHGLGIAVTPLTSANCGWEVNWKPDILQEAEGLPLKNIEVTAGDKTIAGELMITRYGLEGGALYQLGATLRSLENPSLTLDLKPSFTAEELALKIQHASSDLLDAALKSWKLSPVGVSLLKHFSDPHAIKTPLGLAKAAKRITIPLTAPRPLAEAISSAGGVLFSELDDSLMMKRLPGLFVAGEMMDWEAPTGGYLLQGCFATGTRAAKGAIAYLENKQS